MLFSLFFHNLHFIMCWILITMWILVFFPFPAVPPFRYSSLPCNNLFFFSWIIVFQKSCQDFDHINWKTIDRSTQHQKNKPQRRFHAPSKVFASLAMCLHSRPIIVKGHLRLPLLTTTITSRHQLQQVFGHHLQPLQTLLIFLATIIGCLYLLSTNAKLKVLKKKRHKQRWQKKKKKKIVNKCHARARTRTHTYI